VGVCSGGAAQPASKPRIAADATGRRDKRDRGMWVIVLEALLALLLLIFIVWWTMFSGRRRGERDSKDDKP
jgi:hypothetical protein